MFKFFKRKKSSPEQADAGKPNNGHDSDVHKETAGASPELDKDLNGTATKNTVADIKTDSTKSCVSESPNSAPNLDDANAAPRAQESGMVQNQPQEPVSADRDLSKDAESKAPESSAPKMPEPSEPKAAELPVSNTQDLSEPALKSTWISRLRKGLSRTGQNLGGLFIGVKVDEDLFEELETALIMADAGIDATNKLINELRTQVRKQRLDKPEDVKKALQAILTDHLKVLEKPFVIGEIKPMVVMIAGVNGAGKTTSIGKLAHAMQEQQASVLLAAGDTFRAAAREQLVEWGKRNNVTVIAQDGGDPAAVAFDAVNAGRARSSDVVMVDTAGRLPTQLHLMQELKKIKRVISKADGEAPHEILLVVDGNTGQNVLAQIKAFDAALELTGLIVTKLDGTAKGGTLAAVAAGSQGVRPVPVYWVGVGEGMHDLQPFVAAEFAQALLADGSS